MTGMDFTSAGARVRSLIASKKPGLLQKSSLTKDDLRDNVVDDATAHSARFRAALENVPQVSYEVEKEGEVDANGDPVTEHRKFDWSTYPEALRDTARAGFGFDEPEIIGKDKVKPSHLFNREVQANVVASDEFNASRPYTRGNELESMFGAIALSKALQEEASSVAEHIARSEQMQEAENEIGSADEMFEQLRERAREELDAAGEVSDPTKREIKGQVKRRQAARDALKDLIQQHNASNYVGAAHAIGKKAAQAMQEAVEMCGNLPGVGAGSATNLPADKQIELAEKWAKNDQLRKVAQMLGRMIRDMKFKRSARTKNVPIEPVSVTTGRDLELMLPHEMARAYMPELKPLFMKDYAERALLQYEMAGKTPAGKGPIIEVHDGSGSMSGEKFVWATSVALTLLTVAAREKRAFAGIEFGSESELKSWYFPARTDPDPDEVLDFAGHFFGGGTSTVTGMEEALRIIRTEPEFKTADVVLIGDGQDYFREEDKAIRDELRALDVRIHGISILCPSNAYMSQMCEYVVDVIDLAGSNNATDSLAQNLT